MNIDTKGIVELFSLNVKRNHDFGYKDLQNQSKHLGIWNAGQELSAFLVVHTPLAFPLSIADKSCKSYPHIIPTIISLRQRKPRLSQLDQPIQLPHY